MTTLAGQGLVQASTDSFGSFRANNVEAALFAETEGRALKVVIDISTMFLVVTPVLLSSNDQPTRDKSLTEILLRSSPDNFLVFCPAYFDNVREGILNLNVPTLSDFMNKFAEFLMEYEYGRSERTILVLIHILRSSSAIWLQETIQGTETGGKVHQLMQHLCKNYKLGNLYSWRARNALLQFFHDHISQDPMQDSWLVEVASSTVPHFDDSAAVDVSMASSSGTVMIPDPDALDLIPYGGADEDIRVRSFAAVATARLFSVPQCFWVLLPGAPPHMLGIKAYEAAKNHLTTNLKRYVLCIEVTIVI